MDCVRHDAEHRRLFILWLSRPVLARYFASVSGYADVETIGGSGGQATAIKVVVGSCAVIVDQAGDAAEINLVSGEGYVCLLYTSPSPRDM